MNDDLKAEFWDWYHFQGKVTIGGSQLNSPSIKALSYSSSGSVHLTVREEGKSRSRQKNVFVDCAPHSLNKALWESWLTENIGAWTKTAT